ncbi:DENN domain-containing protein 3 isoform X4 [Talpa occidentalis]|uniref:DENN domain-containing protein 3 isoform X4 n=1 Tax=Talpa occidentalis TaxID=50954 RepID=UPI00188EF909|nr:DENN domain-containing protein 3 isoform X4 [Talpa occidentalis]
MAEAAPQGPPPPAGLLELCALLGAPRGRRRGPEQVAQKKGVKGVSLEPEVLSVFVPPFVCQEDGRAASAKGATLSKARRRSFRKKRERPSAEAWQDQPGGPRGPEPEDISVPDGVDLLALPQLCFPGGMCVASAPKEDYVHFLVLTDVCGNRTYGVVAQYHRPLTSTASTTEEHTGSRRARPPALPAASCPSPCAWCPGSPTTTPSRTACPDAQHEAPAGCVSLPRGPRQPPHRPGPPPALPVLSAREGAPDPDVPPDGAACGAVLLQLGPVDAGGRVLPGLPAPAAVAAHLCARPVEPDAGLPHGSHLLPHGLPPRPL